MLSLTEDHCRDSRAVPSIDIHRFTQVSSLVIIIIIIITIIIIIIIINIIIVIVVNIILISLVLYHDLIIFGNAEVCNVGRGKVIFSVSCYQFVYVILLQVGWV